MLRSLAVDCRCQPINYDQSHFHWIMLWSCNWHLREAQARTFKAKCRTQTSMSTKTNDNFSRYRHVVKARSLRRIIFTFILQIAIILQLSYYNCTGCSLKFVTFVISGMKYRAHRQTAWLYLSERKPQAVQKLQCLYTTFAAAMSSAFS